LGDDSLADMRVAFLGRLTSMSRRDAEKLIRDRGGRLADGISDANWLIIGDDIIDLRRVVADRKLLAPAAQAAIESGKVRLVRESELWTRLGLVDADVSVARLYTPAMLAGLVNVPIGAVRRWHHQGVLVAARKVGRLPYFDFGEVCVARKLAALWRAGCSLSSIHRKLEELARLLPNIPRPLADPEIAVEGRRLVVRHGDGLAEPSGQLLIDFDGPRDDLMAQSTGQEPVAVQFTTAATLRQAGDRSFPAPPTADNDELRSLAVELEECGRSDQAIEVYRAILVSGESEAEDHFALAELLYRTGDLAAARERYYVAIELDEDFVEARSNLGCVLAELGELELAEAAFRGALECHPHYADAHYHLARLLDRLGETAGAASHWKRFIELAPASPWVDEAISRVGGQRDE
jgi:tetratricopeptide (TPR) repeat protein